MAGGILLRIGIGVVAATVLAAIVGLFLPSTFEVERSLVIKASPERIHQFTGDLSRWPQWVPWLREEPGLVVTAGEKSTGVGASQTWTADASEGSLIFTRCDPAWGIAYDMIFSKNTYTSTRSLRYRTVPGGTEVVWHMIGDNGNNLLARYFAGLIRTRIGPQFEEGLARLKLVSERAEVEENAVPEG
jgi:hypothetical protein